MLHPFLLLATCAAAHVVAPDGFLWLAVQLRKECELMQQRAEAAEGGVERERGLHRRELRRRAKELADMQEDLVQVAAISTAAGR